MQMDFYYCILVNHFDRSNLRLLICRHRTIVVDWLHRLTDFIDDVHSGSHFTKCCVISIQKVGIRLYNKKLTAGAVRIILRTRHGNHTTFMRHRILYAI